MARKAEFNYRNTPKEWLVNNHGSVSGTGRFRRRYFGTRDEAKSECQRLRKISNGIREKSSDIPEDLAADAISARGILDAIHVTLTQAARFYATHHDKRAKSPTLAEAWEDGIIRRQNHRARYRSDMKAWKKALIDADVVVIEEW